RSVLPLPSDARLPEAIIWASVIQGSRTDAQIGKSGSEVEVDRLNHDTLFLRDRPRGHCTRRRRLIKLLNLHDPLADVGGQFAVPHSLPSGTAPQKQDGLSTKARLATFCSHNKEWRYDAHVGREAGLNVM